MALDTVEEWTVVNDSPLVHPFHIHVNPFQLTHVNGMPVDEPGYRDTVSIAPLGGSITFRTLFADFPGRSVFHCHIVPHSDLGMMGVFEVLAEGQEPEPGHLRVPPLSAAGHHHLRSRAHPGAAGGVERVERGHVVVGQREVEDLRVLLDPLAVGRLREHDDVALQAPADEDLRRRAPEAIGDLPDAVVTEMAAGAERAVGLDDHIALLAAVQQARRCSNGLNWT